MEKESKENPRSEIERTCRGRGGEKKVEDSDAA